MGERAIKTSRSVRDDEVIALGERLISHRAQALCTARSLVGGQDAEDVVQAALERRELLAALDDLPDRQRVALLTRRARKRLHDAFGAWLPWLAGHTRNVIAAAGTNITAGRQVAGAELGRDSNGRLHWIAVALAPSPADAPRAQERSADRPG